MTPLRSHRLQRRHFFRYRAQASEGVTDVDLPCQQGRLSSWARFLTIQCHLETPAPAAYPCTKSNKALQNPPLSNEPASPNPKRSTTRQQGLYFVGRQKGHTHIPTIAGRKVLRQIRAKVPSPRLIEHHRSTIDSRRNSHAGAIARCSKEPDMDKGVTTHVQILIEKAQPGASPPMPVPGSSILAEKSKPVAPSRTSKR